jgi:hypothetical protein
MVYRDLSECRVNEKEINTMPRNNSVFSLVKQDFSKDGGGS